MWWDSWTRDTGQVRWLKRKFSDAYKFNNLFFQVLILEPQNHGQDNLPPGE